MTFLSLFNKQNQQTVKTTHQMCRSGGHSICAADCFLGVPLGGFDCVAHHHGPCGLASLGASSLLNPCHDVIAALIGTFSPVAC